MSRVLISCILLLCCSSASGQRDFFYRDSTIYPITPNTSYIAGRYALYKLSGSAVSLVKDFSIPNDTTLYIRDVDFVNEQKGYVLVGRMYIGGETYLYKTLNGGTTWQLDTSYFPVSKRNSINQVQLLDDQTLVLFDGYYESALIRSFDGGQTWKMWFESLIAHYFQLHRCTNGTWFLIGTPGDGFSSYSFPIPDSLWEKENGAFMSGCHNGAPGCIRVWRDGDRDRATDFIAKQIDTLSKICGSLTTREEITKQPIQLYPNPVAEILFVEYGSGTSLLILDVLGRERVRWTIHSDHEQIDLTTLPNGPYIVEMGSHFQRIQIMH